MAWIRPAWRWGAGAGLRAGAVRLARTAAGVAGDGSDGNGARVWRWRRPMGQGPVGGDAWWSGGDGARGWSRGGVRRGELGVEQRAAQGEWGTGERSPEGAYVCALEERSWAGPFASGLGHLVTYIM